MIDLLLIAALEVTEAKNTHKEPPPIVLNEAQRMAILDLIDQLNREKKEAEDRALFWYQQQKECGGKKSI